MRNQVQQPGVHANTCSAYLLACSSLWMWPALRRGIPLWGLLFYRLLQQAVATDPHPLHTLLRPERTRG